MNIFIDSDVVISSLLSDKGASFQLLYKKNLYLYISSLSYAELNIVIQRFDISTARLDALIKKQLKTIELDIPKENVHKDYDRYVADYNDAHIVAGAHRSNARFLISYNLKHFNRELIQNDFDCIIMTPGSYLQYLRSLNM